MTSAGQSNGALVVVVVHPDLLGTYGDGGNGLVLAQRAAWRGIDIELIAAHSDEPLPTGDLYCLGGGEDTPQVRAAESLRADGALERAHAGGAVVFGVCAGYQLLGKWWLSRAPMLPPRQTAPPSGRSPGSRTTVESRASAPGRPPWPTW